MNTLPRELEDIVLDYQNQLHKHDHQLKMRVVLDELKRNSIYNQFDPHEGHRLIGEIHQRMAHIRTIVNLTERQHALAQIQGDLARLRNPFANCVAPEGQTLEENEELWDEAVDKHREYFDADGRHQHFGYEGQEEMYYWSQMLVYKYAHQDLTTMNYRGRGEHAFGC